MVAADVLRESSTEEAMGITTAGETSEGQPLRWFFIETPQAWVSV